MFLQLVTSMLWGGPTPRRALPCVSKTKTKPHPHLQSHHNLTERRLVDETFRKCREGGKGCLHLTSQAVLTSGAYAQLRTDKYKWHHLACVCSQAQEADSLLSCDYRVVLNQDRSADRFRRDTSQQFELLPNKFSQPLHDSWSCSSDSVGKSMLMP